ncbi:PKD domain-containing protein [Thermophagus sp. OGC60D27]|uniref:PKD domain-containing protein n=1 Tax=Thermophagus sp. OGC60D27 TaxID=3458415 RepID=UPI0040377FF7
MKAIKSVYIFLFPVILLSLFSCSNEGEYELQDPPPLDFKVYIDGMSISFVNDVPAATNVSWDFGDGSTIASGDSVVHEYSSIGNYLITMLAAVDGVSYEYHRVLRVDKASLIQLDDDSFEDWESVTYSDFIVAGKDDVLGAIVDYDANNVYIYVEFNAVEGAGLDSHIFGIYMDTDNSLASGFSLKGIGVDYGLEGNLHNGDIWPSMVDLVNGDSGWPFVGYEPSNPVIVGTIMEEDGVVKMEFGLPRESYAITGDSFQFFMSIMNSDWSDIGSLVNEDYGDNIVVKMDKQ